MSTAVTVVVVVAVVFAVGVGLAAGLDAYAAVILVAILLFGWLALATARRSKSGGVAPALCPSCDGLVSPQAPYCKHCGRRLGFSSRRGGPADGGSARRSG
ncbi:MAG: hypothetical protein ACRDK3_00420 [Actinomycetota bacterium]